MITDAHPQPVTRGERSDGAVRRMVTGPVAREAEEDVAQAAVVVGCSLRWRTQRAMRAEQTRLTLLHEPELSPRMFRTWLWWSSRFRMAEAMTVSPSSSPHSPKPLFEVRMMLPRS